MKFLENRKEELLESLAEWKENKGILRNWQAAENPIQLQLDVLEVMILYYQGEDIDIRNELPKGCLLCGLYRNTISSRDSEICADCLWAKEFPLSENFNSSFCPCLNWVSASANTQVDSSIFGLLRTQHPEICAKRLEILYRWHDDLSAQLPDGSLYCGTCHHETTIHKTKHPFVDEAYGQRAIFDEIEYYTSCCGDDVFYTNPACTIEADLITLENHAGD